MPHRGDSLKDSKKMPAKEKNIGSKKMFLIIKIEGVQVPGRPNAAKISFKLFLLPIKRRL